MITPVIKDSEMLASSCPVCGSSDQSKIFAESNFDQKKIGEFAFASRKFPEYMHYRLVDCPVCDLLYASPMPQPSLLIKAYYEASFDSAQETHYASRTYASFLPGIIRRIPDLDGALDIGTGDGAFLEELAAKGFTRIAGVEPSGAPIAAAKDEIRPLIKNAVFRGDDFPKEGFSLVTCFHAFEHMYEPLEVCRSIYALLKPGAAAFFIYHNRHALFAKLMGIKSPIYDIEHLQLFSKKSVEFLLNKCGFVDIKVKILCNCYPLHYWLKLFPFPLRLKKVLVSGLRKTIIAYVPIVLPAGNFAVICYKRH